MLHRLGRNGYEGTLPGLIGNIPKAIPFVRHSWFLCRKLS
jgi:hypothetical protein